MCINNLGRLQTNQPIHLYTLNFSDLRNDRNAVSHYIGFASSLFDSSFCRTTSCVRSKWECWHRHYSRLSGVVRFSSWCRQPPSVLFTRIGYLKVAVRAPSTELQQSYHNDVDFVVVSFHWVGVRSLAPFWPRAPQDHYTFFPIDFHCLLFFALHMNIIIIYLGHCYILMPDLCTIYMYYRMYSYHDFCRTVVTTI